MVDYCAAAGFEYIAFTHFLILEASYSIQWPQNFVGGQQLITYQYILVLFYVSDDFIATVVI